VPFLCTTAVPGPWLYHTADLYHCSIIDILWEKLASIQDDKLFHYELYQLRWTPPHLDTEVSIYGDLYMSMTFHKAHSDLQNLLREPDCDLPRVVAGLMFWPCTSLLLAMPNCGLPICTLEMSPSIAAASHHEIWAITSLTLKQYAFSLVTVWSPNFLLPAPLFVQRLSCREWHERQMCNTLSSRTLSWVVENFVRRWIPWGVRAWHCDLLLQLHQA
jgi:hypothetical protein